ncbi:hypothetical protein HELRODRAFT_173369 [Helobdella robusta]|uniref:BAT2 N-terminal domain-containing protein n=1 Tax=Helobdella robusta TaxID=6412 RepID=T1F6Q5_HELRO|nr:hypothetical protein HELRODRAFT_173369 [Helobdella robusta]ESO03671.1 hypothetical protein HELRODRAFT_173369 [Helobdella robusta]
MSSVLSSSTSTTNTTNSSTTSKNEKQSTKFKGIDINTIYKGSNASPPKANTTTRQHGLQVLGKVQSVRRMPPPANLPSIKSLTSSTNTSQQQQQQQSKEGSNIVTSTASGNIQSTNNINNSLSTLSGFYCFLLQMERRETDDTTINDVNDDDQQLIPRFISNIASISIISCRTSIDDDDDDDDDVGPEVLAAAAGRKCITASSGHMTAGEAGVLWSDITSGGRRHYLDHKSFSLQEDFPELTAEGKAATTATSLAMAGQSEVKRTGAEPREKSSGLGPSLKPQNLASWRDGGGKVVGPSQTPQSRSPSPQAVDPNKKQHEQSADYTGHPPVLAMPQQPLGVGRMQHNYPPPPPFMGPCRGTDGGVMMHPPGPHPYPPHHPSRHVMPPVPYVSISYSTPTPYRPGFHPSPTSSGYPNFIPPPPPMRGRGPPGAFRPPPPPFMAPHHDFNYPPGPYPHPHHHQMSDRMEEPSKRIPSLKTSVVKEKDLELFDRLKISEDKVWARGNVNVDYSEKLVFSDDEDNGKTSQKSNDNLQQQQQHPKFGTTATSKTLTSSKMGGGSSGHLERDWKSEEPLKLGVSTASTVPGQSPLLLEHSKSCEPSQYAGRKDGICSSSSNTAVGGGSGSGSSGGGGEVNRMPAPPLRQSNIMPEAATTTGGYYHGGGAGNRQPHNNEYYEKQWSSDQHGLPTQQHPRMPHHPRDQPQSQFASQHHQLQQLLQQPQHYSRRPPPPPGLSSSSNTAAPANYNTIDDNNPKPYRTSSSSNNNVSNDGRYNIANKTSNLYGGRGDYDYEDDDDMEVSLRRTKDDDNVDPDRWKSGNYRQELRRLDDVDVHSVEARGNYDGACVEKEPNNKLLFNNNSNNKSSVSNTDLTSTQQQYQQQQLQQLKSSSINSSLHMADNANNNDSNMRTINKSISQHAISQLDKDYPHHQLQQLHQPRMMPQHQQQYTQGQKYMPPQQQQQQQQQRRPDSNPCLIPQQTTTTPTTPSNFLDTPPVRMPQPSSPLTSNSSFGGLWGPSYDHRWSNMPSQQQPRPPLMPPPLQPQLPQEQHGSGGGAAVVSAANEGCNKTAPTSKSHLEHSGSLESMYPVVIHKKPLLGQAPPPTRYYYPPYPPQPAYMQGGYHGGGRGAPGRGAAAVKTPATMMRDSEIASSPGLSKNRRTVHDDVIVDDADDNNTGRDNGNIKDGDEDDDDDGGDVMDLRRRNHAGGAHSRRNNFNDVSEDGNEGCSPRDDYHHQQQQQPQLSRQMSGGSRPTFQQQPEERKIIIHRNKSESERSDASKNEPAARDVRERDATSSSVVTSNLQSATERIMSRNHEKGFRSQQQHRQQTYDERSSDCIRYDDNLDDDNDYYVGGEEHADEYYYHRRRKDVAREVKGHSHDEYNDEEGDDCDRRIVKNGRQLYDYKNVAAAGPGTSSQQPQHGRVDHAKRSNIRGGDARNYGHNRDGAEEYARRKFYEDDIYKKYVDAKNVAPHHHLQEDDNDGDKNDDGRGCYGNRDKRDSEEKQQTQQQHSARTDNSNTDRHQPTYQTTRQQQQHARQQQSQQHSRQQQLQQQQNSRSSHPPPISLDQAHENKHDESHFTSLKKQRPATTNISASTTTKITTTTATTSASANNPTTNNIATGSNCSSGNVVVGKSDISSQKEVSARQDNFNLKLDDECGKISEETNKMRSNINVDSSAHNIKDASTSDSRTDSSYNKKKPSANFDVSRRREPETVKQYKKEHCDYDYSDDYYYSNYEDDRDQRYDYYNSKSYPGGSRKWNKPSAGRTDEGQRKDTYNFTSNFPGGGGSSGNNSNSTAYVNSRRGNESNCPEKVENYKEKFLPKENDDKMDDGNKSREASKSDSGAVGNEGPAGSMDNRSYHTKYRPSKPLYQCSYEEEREDDDRKYSHDTGSKASGRFYVPPKSKGSSYCHAGDRDECDADSFGGVAGRGGSRNYTGDLHDEKAGGKKFANDDDGGGSSSRSSVEKQHQQQQQRDPVDANRGGSFRSKQQYQLQQPHQTNKPLRMPGNEKKAFDGNASSRNKMTKDARGAEIPASQQHLSDNTASKSGGNVVGKKFDNDSNHISGTATPSNIADGSAKNFSEKNSSNKPFDECSSFTKDTNKSSAVLEKNTSASSNSATAAAAAATASSNIGRGGVEKSRSNKIGGRGGGGGGGGGAGVSERYSNSNDRYENTHAELKYAAGREFVRGGSTRGGGVANPVNSSGRGARSGATGGGGGRRSEMKKTHSTEDLKQQNVVEKLTSSSQSAAANAASGGSCGGGGVGRGNVNNNSSTVDEVNAVNCGKTAQGSKNYDVGDGASVGGASSKDENISSNKRSSESAAKESSLSSSSSSQLHKPRHYNHHYYRPGIKSGAAAATTAAAGGGGGGKMAPSNSSGVTGGGHFFSGGARSEKFSSNSK